MRDQDSLAPFGNLDAWTRAAQLFGGALRRRWPGIVALTMLFVGAGTAAAVLLPRTYSTEARILIKKNYVMPALANPRRAVPSGSEAAAQAATASVLSRESLEAIIRANALVARWDAERPLLLAIKDRVVTVVRGPLSDADKLDALVEVLGRRITVDVTDDVVTVKAVWTDRKTALDLVTGAQAAFLESRRRFDVQSVADTLAILETSASAVQDQMRRRLDDVVARQREDQAARETRLERRRAAARPAVRTTRAEDPLDGLRTRVRETRSLRLVLERRFQEQLVAAQTRLSERRAVLTEKHPDIAALERSLATARQEPADLVDARAAESRLLGEYTAKGGALGLVDEDPRVRAAETAANSGAQAAAELSVFKDDEEDDATAYARSLLKGSVETYQDLVARIENARIELQTAEAAFRYRYSVVAPARLPRKPDAPNVPLIVVASLLTGLATGVVRAVFVDLRDRALLSPRALGAHLTAAPAPMVSAA